MPCYIELARCTRSDTQKYHISVERDLCLLMVLFAMPAAVALSQWTGVAGWGWPNSSRISLIILPSLQFKNNAPSSASAAEDASNFRIVQRVKSASLRRIGSPSFGSYPRKKWPHARLRALVSDRYDASE